MFIHSLCRKKVDRKNVGSNISITMDAVKALQKLGFNDKEIRIYLMMLSLGPAPVRKIAQASGINRGTAYDILKTLMDKGLVVYYNKDKKQYFSAEDPAYLERHLDGRLKELGQLKEYVHGIVTELKSVQDRGGGKPVARYYEGLHEVRRLLQDVLDTMDHAKPKLYRVFSTDIVREHLYKSFPDFTKQRIKHEIIVKVIALGPGGTQDPLSERKWLAKEHSAPAYTIIYGNKTAHIGVAINGDPVGMVVEDENIAKTQVLIFETLWASLH